MATESDDKDMGVQLGQTLLNIVHDIGNLARSRSLDSPFKKDCSDLTRRISLLSHLFEEINEFFNAGGHPSPPPTPPPPSSPSSSNSPSSSSPLDDLIVILQASKRLLIAAGSCSDSNTLLDDAGKKIASEFQRLTWLLERTLRKLPYNHFNISDEVREQIELVRSQLRRAVERYGSLNPRLLSHASAQPLEQKVDPQEFINRWLSNLHNKNVGNTEHDSQAIPDILPKDNERRRHSKDQVICEQKTATKPSSSSQEDSKLMEADANKADQSANDKNSNETKKPDSVAILDDFRCPISLELMRDPVIVSTGQTYERSCIQRWIDCGNKTCPKTQQTLSNVTLTPNYVLRSLITQWCEKNNIEQQIGTINGRIRKSDGSLHEVSSEMATINALVRKLSSRSVDERRRAASEIRTLSKRSTDNRILIAEAGAIPVLVNLLTTDDARTQEHAVTSILNLSIYENNKGLIILAGAVPSIVQVLRMGSMEARENAAATLFSLSLLDENKITIGASGAIPALVELLRQGSSRGKKDAATALFNLCIYQGNKGRAVRAGILVPLMKMLTDSSGCLVDEALTILSVLACHQEGKDAIAKASIIPVLIDLMRTGQPRIKENSAAILLALSKKDAENLAFLGRLGAVIPLTELAKSGTERAKRKATSLLQHLRKLQQL